MTISPAHPVRLLAMTAMLLLLARSAAAEPDDQLLGRDEGYPRGTPATMYAERFKVGSFSASDRIRASRIVPHGSQVWKLKTGPTRPIRYRLGSAEYTLDDYLDRQRVTALVVLKDDAIVAERYRYGRGEHDRFLSFSMAKSVNSLLVGIAREKGIIGSLDDPAEKYVTELKGAPYGQATIAQLMRMSSGVEFSERYDGLDDLARLVRAERGEGVATPLEVLASFRRRAFPAGERFGYASAETSVVGYVLSRAARLPVATLTSQWLWKPMGAEADAAWNIATDGQEQTMGGFNATARDYARLGLLLARDGEVEGRQVVPREYLLAATDAARQPAAFRPGTATPYFGYGLQFWLFPMRTRTFALLGIYGQAVFVQPESKLVMVHLAVQRTPRDPAASAERDALWRGVLTSLGGMQ